MEVNNPYGLLWSRLDYRLDTSHFAKNVSCIICKQMKCYAYTQQTYLHVDISPVVDQELQTESSVCGGGGEVQRGEALVVGLADVGTVIDQLTDDVVLTVKTGQMERRVPKCVGLINLLSESKQD